jgi:arylsulfatase A-like enzyme
MLRRDFIAALGGAAAALGQTRRPNIVLIYADDLGYGDVGCYGAKRVKTPNLDRMAARGLRFTNAHSSSATCTPSRYSLLTGEYAWRKPGTAVLPGDATMIIEPGRVTAASMLKQAGYATGVVGKWHLGLGKGKVDWHTEIVPGPREIGFDYSFLIPATGDRVPCVYVENQRVVGLDPADPIRVAYDQPIAGEPLGREHPEMLKMHPSHGHDMAIVNGVSRIGYMSGGKPALWTDEDMAHTITSRATSFIDRNKTRPFFLYFATHDIHGPRVPHPRFAGKTGMGPRGDAIVEFDWSVGRVMESLERNGLARNTLVIVSSDNGPVVDDGYRDEAVEKLGDHKPAGPLRGGKYSKFEAGTRVPFIVRWPERVRGGRVTDAAFSQVDLLASFAAVAGQRVPEGAGPDSMNMLAALTGESGTGRPYVVEHAGTLGVIEGEWKYIAPNKGVKVQVNTNTETGNDPGPQLYRLSEDIGERRNVAAEFPERVKAMEGLLERVRRGN